MKKILFFALILTVIGCGKSKSLNQTKGESFVELLNQNSDEITYEVAKADTRKEGWVVFKQTLGEQSGYIAYDLNNFEVGYTYDEYMETVIADVFTPYAVYLDGNYADMDLYIGVQAITLLGEEPISYPDPDLTYVFEEVMSGKKDLEKLGSEFEAMEYADIQDHLSSNFGMADDRAHKVAKIVGSYKKIQNKRALTDREMNTFSKQVFGFNYNLGMDAVSKHIQGDSSEMDTLIDQAAEKNEISPEAVKELVGEYLLN
ncbi:MAG: hypothetical protein E2O68_05525 [Deltaproteobacteria bacterium]|nr:MAG: hypothetical protein E2O68_05525 [Deltaproteobacteria bacterium]